MLVQNVKLEHQEEMRSSVSEIFVPSSEEMVAGIGGSGWDHKSYDPLIDHYLTFAGLGDGPSLDYTSAILPDSQTIL